MDITSLLIQLVSGAIGGNAAGAALPDKSLGTVGNSIAGLLGGGVGAAVLQALGVAASSGGGGDLTSILGNVASGGVGGGIAMVVIGAIRTAMSQRA